MGARRLILFKTTGLRKPPGVLIIGIGPYFLFWT